MDTNEKLELRRVATRLRKLAQENIDLAKGSSRVDGYTAIAQELNQQATNLENMAR